MEHGGWARLGLTTDHSCITAQMCVLRRWAVPAEPPDPCDVARLRPVIDGNVVVAAVVVPLDVKLLERQLNDLMREGPRDEVYRVSGENHRAFKSTVYDCCFY